MPVKVTRWDPVTGQAHHTASFQWPDYFAPVDYVTTHIRSIFGEQYIRMVGGICPKCKHRMTTQTMQKHCRMYFIAHDGDECANNYMQVYIDVACPKCKTSFSCRIGYDEDGGEREDGRCYSCGHTDVRGMHLFKFEEIDVPFSPLQSV